MDEDKKLQSEPETPEQEQEVPVNEPLETTETAPEADMNDTSSVETEKTEDDEMAATPDNQPIATENTEPSSTIDLPQPDDSQPPVAEETGTTNQLTPEPALDPETSTEPAVQPTPVPEVTAADPTVPPVVASPDMSVPEESKHNKNKKRLLLGLIGLVFVAGLAVLGYMLFFATASPQSAFNSMISNLTDSPYIESTQDVDSGLFEGTFTSQSDFSNKDEPKSQGSFDYTVSFFANVNVREEFAAIKDVVHAQFTRAELNGEAQSDEDLNTPLNQWVKVAEGGEILVSDFSTSSAAYALNTVLGALPMGELEGEAEQTAREALQAALVFQENEVTSEEIDGQEVYKYKVTIDSAKIIELNKRLQEEFGVFVADSSFVGNEANYVSEAELYVAKKTKRLVRTIERTTQNEQETVVTTNYRYLDTAPDISLPEVQFTPEPTEEVAPPSEES